MTVSYRIVESLQHLSNNVWGKVNSPALAKRYESSLRSAQTAWWRCYIIGAIEMAVTIKELIVANLYELGKIEVAERIVASISRDPFGREGLVLQ